MIEVSAARSPLPLAPQLCALSEEVVPRIRHVLDHAAANRIAAAPALRIA